MTAVGAAVLWSKKALYESHHSRGEREPSHSCSSRYNQYACFNCDCKSPRILGAAVNGIVNNSSCRNGRILRQHKTCAHDRPWMESHFITSATSGGSGVQMITRPQLLPLLSTFDKIPQNEISMTSHRVTSIFFHAVYLLPPYQTMPSGSRMEKHASWLNEAFHKLR